MKALVSTLKPGDVFRTADRHIAHVAETFGGFLRALVWKDDEQGNRVQRAELFMGHELVEVGGKERRGESRRYRKTHESADVTHRLHVDLGRPGIGR